MNNKTNILLAILFTACATQMSCSGPEKKMETARENVVDASNNLEEAKKEYIADVERYRISTNERIAANDKLLADLKAAVGKDKLKAKKEYSDRIFELEKKNAEMKKKMNEYKAEEQDKWENFKTEFNHDLDGLGDAFRDMTVKNTETKK